MSIQSPRSEIVKKADRVADLSFWLLLLMLGFLLIALFFKIPSDVVGTASWILALVGWLIKIVESKLLRRALESSGVKPNSAGMPTEQGNHDA